MVDKDLGLEVSIVNIKWRLPQTTLGAFSVRLSEMERAQRRKNVPC
jgi:hypothetical protein